MHLVYDRLGISRPKNQTRNRMEGEPNCQTTKGEAEKWLNAINADMGKRLKVRAIIGVNFKRLY